MNDSPRIDQYILKAPLLTPLQLVQVTAHVYTESRRQICKGLAFRGLSEHGRRYWVMRELE